MSVMALTELDTRVMATEIIERLIARGFRPFNITINPNGSGVTVRCVFRDPPLFGLWIEAHVPPGFFAYDRIADDLCLQIQKATTASD